MVFVLNRRKKSLGVVLYALLYICISLPSFAQDWNIDFIIDPYPSPYISDWESNPTIAQATIENLTDSTAWVRVRLTLDHSERGRIGNASSNIFDFPPGSIRNITNPDLVDWGSIDYEDDIVEIAVRTGRIPDGQYTACIRLEDAYGDLLHEEVCATFTIVYSGPPELDYPCDGDEVYDIYPMFQWTPFVAPPDFPVHYIFRIVEVYDGQVASQAMAANETIYIIYRLLSSNFQYPTDALPLEFGKTYAWQVQVLDSRGMPPATNNGFSNICAFRVRNPYIPPSVGGQISDVETGEDIHRARVIYYALDMQVSGQDTTWTEIGDSVITNTGDDGRYEFPSVDDSAYFKIKVSAKNYITKDSISRKKTSDITGDVNVELEYAPPGDLLLAGTVKDILSGQPIPHIPVTYTAMDRRSDGTWVENSSKQLTAVTDANGYFKFTQAAKDQKFVLRASPDASRYYPACDTLPMQTEDVDNRTLFVKPKACNITGKVTTKIIAGKNLGRYEPVSGALVVLIIDKPSVTENANGKLDVKYTRMNISVYSKSDGTFAFENFNIADKMVSGYHSYGYTDDRGIRQHGSYRYSYYPKISIKIVDPQFFPYDTPDDSIITLTADDAGTTVETGEYRLMPYTGTIAGTVTDKSGNPVVTEVDDKTLRVSIYYLGDEIISRPTDTAGKYIFENIPINDPIAQTDCYIIHVESQRYVKTVKTARITKHNQKRIVDFALIPAKGLITGQITNNALVGLDGARVELLGRVSNTEVYDLLDYLYEDNSSLEDMESPDVNGDGVSNLLDLLQLIHDRYENSSSGPDDQYYKEVQWAATSGGGHYTINEIDSGFYQLRIIKTGFVTKTFEPFHVCAGYSETRDEILEVAKGSLDLTVLNAADTTEVVGNADVHIKGELKGSTDNGRLYIPNVSAGNIELTFLAIGFADLDTTVLIQKDSTLELTVYLERRVGKIKVIVKEKDTEEKLEYILVSLDNRPPVETNALGEAWLENAPVGNNRVLKVSPPPDYDADYDPVETTIPIVEGLNTEPITIELTPASRIRGHVLNSEAKTGIPKVLVSIEGNPQVHCETDSLGSFLLRNVPADQEVTLSAIKSGFKKGTATVTTPASGSYHDWVMIHLEPSPIDSLFGFAIIPDTISDLSNGQKKISGEITDIPPCFGVKTRTDGATLRFEDVIVDSNYIPIAKTIVLATSEFDVNAFGMDAKMRYEGGLLLEWVDSVKAGRITGNIEFGDIISNAFPETDWIPITIPKIMAPSFWAGGINRRLSKYGLSATDTEYQLTLKGVTVGVDFTKSHVDTAGVHFYGSLALGEKLTFKFEELLIGKKDGKITLKAITIKTDPPVKIPFGVFTVVDSSMTWDYRGFRAKGAIVLTALENREFGFENLHISPKGEFLSVAVTADEKNGTIKVCGQQFQIEKLEFGTENWEDEQKENVMFFAFSGNLKLTKLDKPVLLQNLKYTEKNEFTGKIAFNQSKTFAKIVTIQLGAIEFGKHEEKGQFVGITGGVNFGAVKGLSLQASDLRFYFDGAVEFEKISAELYAGPAQVELFIGYADDVFSGGGTINVRPVFSAGAEFRYGGSKDWWIKIISGTRIPMGPVELIQASGGLGRKGETWMFSLGGVIAPPRAEKGVSLDIDVKVELTPKGVIIIGNADVELIGKYAIGRAYLEINIPEERVIGSIQFGYDADVIKLTAYLDFGVQFGKYWYIYGHGNINFLEFFKADGVIAVANNWEWTHDGKTQTLSGFYLELNSDFKFDADWYIIRWGVYFNRHAMLYIGWSGDFAGEIEMAGGAYAWIGLDLGIFEIDLITVRGDIALGAKIYKTGSDWGAAAHAGIRLEAILGSCRSGGCWSICWKCYVRVFGACVFALPTGAKACAVMQLYIDYNSTSGIDVKVDI